MEQQIARISKGGWKQLKGMFGWQNNQKLALAVFITPSLREILKTFGKNILALKGIGNKNEKSSNKSDIGGFEFLNIKKSYCKINYKRSKYGILDEKKIIQINKLLDEYGLIDCSVEYLKIEIEDDNLKDVINSFYKGKINFEVLTNIFQIELILEKCEGEYDKEKWEATPYNNEILIPAGFKRSMLHCIKLIDDGQVYNLRKKSRRFYYINWEPSNKSVNIEELNSPIEIVSALKPNLQPYGYIKNYKLDKQNKLVLTGMS